MPQVGGDVGFTSEAGPVLTCSEVVGSLLGGRGFFSWFSRCWTFAMMSSGQRWCPFRGDWGVESLDPLSCVQSGRFVSDSPFSQCGLASSLIGYDARLVAPFPSGTANEGIHDFEAPSTVCVGLTYHGFHGDVQKSGCAARVPSQSWVGFPGRSSHESPRGVCSCVFDVASQSAWCRLSGSCGPWGVPLDGVFVLGQLARFGREHKAEQPVSGKR